jgi:predicted tellurium resistance membrane protein TerC
MALIADGFGFHIPKGYIYAAMAFSTFIESLNLLSRKAKRKTRGKGGGAPTS